MRNFFLTVIFIFFIINGMPAQMAVSGILDSTVTMGAGAFDTPDFTKGFEQFANLRFQSRLREGGTVFGSVNLIAASGSFAEAAQQTAEFSPAPPGINSTAYFHGQNFIAAIELERLHVRLRGEHVDFDGGLMRLPFGYGQIWGSSDFLNPRNPLKPDARPRGILGTTLTWYPIEELKLLGFYAAPRNALSFEGKGSLFGLSADRHWDKASLQALYSFETPDNGSEFGIHRAGLSIKADIEIGVVMEALYTYNHEARTAFDGLSFSIGADYSFFSGNLIVLAEYLYNGENSSTSRNSGGDFANNHYLYTGFTYSFNDFTNMSAGLISGLSDISFTPMITFNHNLFQGVVLTISAQVPLDGDLFTGNGKRGEFGPLPPDHLQPFSAPELGGRRFGSYFNCSIRLRIRF